jgi:V/A-type H+-transporting ATPase subunit I
MLWVDLLVDRDAVQEAIRLLAASSIIELRSYDRSDLPFEIAGDTRFLERLNALDDKLDHYRKYLPDHTPGTAQSDTLARTADVLPEIEARVAAWLERVSAAVEQLEHSQSELEEYGVLQRCLKALPDGDFDLRYFITLSKSQLYSSFIALGTDSDGEFFRGTGQPVLYNAYPLADDEEACVFIGVAATPQMADLERAAHSAGIRFLRVPAEIQGSSREALSQLAKPMEAASQDIATRRAEIDQASEALNIAANAWNLNRHLWVSRVLTDALQGTRFVWLGGWMAARRYPELLRILEDGNIPFLVNRDTTNQHGAPPALLDNPRWMRKFEVFVRGFGMPAQNDIDPTPLLAVTTPLMFGYMFGDVGHGLVLCLAGWLLRRRIPVLALLVPAGIVSILFGFAFGSIFSNEHLLPALWLQPMSAPLTILGIPLVFGFVFISTGLLLAGIQAHWHAGAGTWWLEQLPVILIYCVAPPLALWDWRVSALLAFAGALWYVAARGLSGLRERSLPLALGGATKGLLELVELIAQLLINTLSFARLGAFALAHAGLSTAVMTLADLAESWWIQVPVLILGNVVVIALEGLVVSIQTTRLVMFEFFRRFYAGEGNSFKPLTLPHDNHGSLRNSQS